MADRNAVYNIDLLRINRFSQCTDQHIWNIWCKFNVKYRNASAQHQGMPGLERFVNAGTRTATRRPRKTKTPDGRPMTCKITSVRNHRYSNPLELELSHTCDTCIFLNPPLILTNIYLAQITVRFPCKISEIFIFGALYVVSVRSSLATGI